MVSAGVAAVAPALCSESSRTLAAATRSRSETTPQSVPGSSWSSAATTTAWIRCRAISSATSDRESCREQVRTPWCMASSTRARAAARLVSLLRVIV
jgi:hypothetical protein